MGDLVGQEESHVRDPQIRARTLRIAASLVLLTLTGWLFVMVVWIPLYSHKEKAAWVLQQDEPPLHAEITREDRNGTRSWSVQDQQALRKLQHGLMHANYAGSKEPKADQSFRLRIRRSDSKVDEYEVQLDERGSEHDMLYVVRRTGGGAVYGSAFKTPELRSALQQVLKEK
jgi:hypothetical protein